MTTEFDGVLVDATEAVVTLLLPKIGLLSGEFVVPVWLLDEKGVHRFHEQPCSDNLIIQNRDRELGLFLARLNFGLTFGRFALDAERGAIWFDEAILGEEFREEELRFAVQMVSTTADQWDDRLKQMFGGAKYQEVLSQKRVQPLPISKPGEGVAGQYL